MSLILARAFLFFFEHSRIKLIFDNARIFDTLFLHLSTIDELSLLKLVLADTFDTKCENLSMKYKHLFIVINQSVSFAEIFTFYNRKYNEKKNLFCQ